MRPSLAPVALVAASVLLAGACNSASDADTRAAREQTATMEAPAPGEGAAAPAEVDLEEFLAEALAPFEEQVDPAGQPEQPTGDGAAAAAPIGQAEEPEPGAPEPAPEPEPGAPEPAPEPEPGAPEPAPEPEPGAPEPAASEPTAGTIPGREEAAVASIGEGTQTQDISVDAVVPLTGELTSDFFLAQRRAVAVKVDNGGLRPRPQFGLAAADIVYEVLVEGGFTRFLAVYHSEIPDRIGPVRSVRSSDMDLLADLGTPYLASSGANSVVLREMREAGNAGVLIDAGALRGVPAYSLDRSRRAPHNRFFHYTQLLDSTTASTAPATVTPLFEYGSTDEPGMDGAAGVTVTYSFYGNVVSHIWDAGVGGWVRIQNGELHTAESDFGTVEIAPTNVAVLWLPYTTSAADPKSPQALSYGSGDALVLTAGAVHQAAWERSEGRRGFRLTDADGNVLGLSPGSTWVILANRGSRQPVAEVTTVNTAEGARLLAEARAAAAAEQAASS